MNSCFFQIKRTDIRTDQTQKSKLSAPDIILPFEILCKEYEKTKF